jgi:hypothetical protein
MKNMVKFTNDNTLTAKGVGDALIMRKDDKRSVISNVLYIPGMKSNLPSIGQLVENNYSVNQRQDDESSRFKWKVDLEGSNVSE